MSDLPHADLDAAIDFLKWHAPDGLWVLTAIDPELPQDDPNKCKTQTFTAPEEDRVRAWLDQHDRRNHYYSVNPTMGPTKKKAKREDIKSLAWLHVDIDPRPGTDIAREQARALALLTTDLPISVPPPSAVVYSGGGYQALWRLAAPVPINGEAAAFEDAKRYNQQLEKLFDADHCHNVDRIMRLPGTVNWPDAGKRAKGRAPALARVEVTNDLAYPIDAFVPAPPATAAGGGGTVVKVDTANVKRVADLSELDKWGVPDRVKVIINQGHDPDRPKQGDNTRSAWLYDAVCNLARCGVPDDVIFGVITDKNFAISDSVLENGRNAEMYALRQIERARRQIELGDAGWLDTFKDGSPRPTWANARVAIPRLGLQCSYDVFRDRQFIGGMAVQQYAGEITDRALLEVRGLIRDRLGFDVGEMNVDRAVSKLAQENAFDPVRDELAGLVWDGQLRLDRWLARYLGAADTPLNSAIGRKVLCAAVRRVMQPGCKFDHVLVLEGRQSSGKSTAVRVLAGHDDLFSDQDIVHLDAKAQQEALRGKWIYEIAELAGLGKTDTEKVKAFVTRQYDRARPAYARKTEDVPRRCIFIATTNDAHWARDQSGNRRFWPVPTGVIDIEALRRDRDQLLAEAVAVEAAGEELYLSMELESEIAVAQEDRIMADPWMDLLADVTGEVVGDEERVGTAALLRWPLDIEPGRQTHRDATRLRDCMRRLGWRGPVRHRVKGVVVNGYARDGARAREAEARERVAAEGQLYNPVVAGVKPRHF